MDMTSLLSAGTGMATGGVTTLLPALFQMGMGIYQTARGYKESRTPQPEYQIAPALQTMVGNQRQQAQGELPGMSAMKSDQRQTTANMLDNMMKMGIANPNAVAGAYGNESAMMGNIGIQGANWRTAQNDKYASALSMLSQEEKAKQEWDTLLPWERKMQTASADIGAGFQNMYGALGGVADKFGTRAMMGAMGYDVPSFFGQRLQQNSQPNFSE